jgi:glutathione S-transferase
MQIIDEQLAKTEFLAGDALSYGDILVGIMCYCYRKVAPGRPRSTSTVGTMPSHHVRRLLALSGHANFVR